MSVGWCKIVAWHYGSLDGNGLNLYSRNLYQVLEHNDLYFATISLGKQAHCGCSSFANQTILGKSTTPYMTPKLMIHPF